MPLTQRFTSLLRSTPGEEANLAKVREALGCQQRRLGEVITILEEVGFVSRGRGRNKMVRWRGEQEVQGEVQRLKVGAGLAGGGGGGVVWSFSNVLGFPFQEELLKLTSAEEQ